MTRSDQVRLVRDVQGLVGANAFVRHSCLESVLRMVTPSRVSLLERKP